MVRVQDLCDLSDPDSIERQLVRRMSDQWLSIVVYHLADGPVRFNELGRRIGGVSQKMLTQTLRGMERDGLVERRVHPVVPPKVEYRLSALGESFVEPLAAMWRWAAERGQAVEQARTSYDQRRQEAGAPDGAPKWPSETRTA